MSATSATYAANLVAQGMNAGDRPEDIAREIVRTLNLNITERFVVAILAAVDDETGWEFCSRGDHGD